MSLLPEVSDPRLRLGTTAIAVAMALVVASGWIPGWYAWVGGERLLLGLFVLSPLDDITHGLTALAFLYAAVRNTPAVSRFLCAMFGGYYSLDAIFFLGYGFVNEKTWLQDIALNAPHVLLGSLLMVLAYRGSGALAWRRLS